METHCNILAWKSSWTEELGRLQSKGPQELGTTELLNMHAQAYSLCNYFRF